MANESKGVKFSTVSNPKLPRISMTDQNEGKGGRVSMDSNSNNNNANSNSDKKPEGQGGPRGSDFKEDGKNRRSSSKSKRFLASSSRSTSKSRLSELSQRSSEIFYIPQYLDPQPKFFIDHMKEDMIVETFDPLADSDEEEVVVEEAFNIAAEYDDDFDYESLYSEQTTAGGDDYDDYISNEPVPESETQLLPISKKGEGDELGEEGAEGEEEEGEGEEEGGGRDQETTEVDDDNLDECDDRSDEEIANERIMQELYETAFANIASLHVTKEVEVEAPSITQKSLDEYFMEREEDKIAIYKEEYSGWYYTEGCEVLYRRKIQACLDSILVKERKKYSGIKDDFRKRWELGQSKQVVIDAALAKFENYYKETLTKKNRAVRKTAHELQQRILKVHEVNRNNKELECLLKLQSLCEKRLERFRIFERYLEKVRDESQGEFSDIRDVIDRYGVLSQARSGLISRDLKNQDKIERAQNSLTRTMELRSNEILVYNNYLSELRVFRDNLNEEILQLEEMLLHIKTTAAGRTLLIGQIKMAINNLYLGLCKQLGRAGKIPPEDILRQLSYVNSSMREIIKLNRDVKQMLKAAAHAAEKDARDRARVERENKKRKFKHAKLNKETDINAIFGFPILDD